MAIDMTPYRRQRGSSASQSGASSDKVIQNVRDSAKSKGKDPDFLQMSQMLGSISPIAGVYGIMLNQKAEKAKIKQLQINLRLQQEKRANVQQLGQIDIADQMGLALSNRLQGALQMGGSNSEVYAQEGRNMNFSLRSQLHDMLVQEVQTQNEIYSAQFAKKAQLWSGLADLGAGAGKAVAQAMAGGGAG